MDFVTDQLFDGRKIRALTVRGRPAVDNYSRQCLAIHVGQSLKGEDVVAVMNHLKIVDLAIPQRIQVDNGSEFISKAMDLWAYDNGVTLDFSRPGKPTDNPFIESFNGSFRDECLNAHRSGAPVVPIFGRCQGKDRVLARRIQFISTAQFA